jgi:hypothetical protein
VACDTVGGAPLVQTSSFLCQPPGASISSGASIKQLKSETTASRSPQKAYKRDFAGMWRVVGRGKRRAKRNIVCLSINCSKLRFHATTDARDCCRVVAHNYLQPLLLRLGSFRAGMTRTRSRIPDSSSCAQTHSISSSHILTEFRKCLKWQKHDT